MKYRLYYRDLLVADVEEQDADFPSFFGRYQLASDIDRPELAHVRAYLDYSVRVWPLMEQDRFDQIDLDEEKAFTDLIESDDWYLIAAGKSERIPILVPMFFTDGGFIWRLNPRCEKHDHVA